MTPLPPIPARWCWVRAEEIADNTPHSLVIGPFGSDLKTTDFTNQGVPVVFVKNVKPNRFVDGPNPRFVSSKKARKLSAHAVHSGDLVITKMGQPPCVAAV